MRQTGRKRAFTLIELLVVIGIISMLIGLLVPALSSAKQMAKGVDCMSNLRQMSLAVQMYSNEWDGYYPPAWVIADSCSITWCGKYYEKGGIKYMDVTGGPLWPYLQDKKVMRCRTFRLSYPQVKFAGSGEISGYGINCQYVAGDPVVDRDDGAWGMTSWARPARASQLKRPGQTILFADCARVKKGVYTEEIFIYPLYKHDSTDKNYATFHFRHRDRANVAFCDGRVESIEPLELDPAGDGKCGWVANKLMDRH